MYFLQSKTGQLQENPNVNYFFAVFIIIILLQTDAYQGKENWKAINEKCCCTISVKLMSQQKSRKRSKCIMSWEKRAALNAILKDLPPTWSDLGKSEDYWPCDCHGVQRSSTNDPTTILPSNTAPR